MKTKHYILLALAGLTAFLAGFIIGKDRTEKPPGTVTETKETTVDTIPYYAPMPQSELALGTHRYTLPTYRFLGGGVGGEPRQRDDKDSICEDSIISLFCTKLRIKIKNFSLSLSKFSEMEIKISLSSKSLWSLVTTGFLIIASFRSTIEYTCLFFESSIL